MFSDFCGFIMSISATETFLRRDRPTTNEPNPIRSSQRLVFIYTLAKRAPRGAERGAGGSHGARINRDVTFLGARARLALARAPNRFRRSLFRLGIFHRPNIRHRVRLGSFTFPLPPKRLEQKYRGYGMGTLHRHT